MSNDNLPDIPWTLGEYWPPIEPRLNDDELVCKWVQAMSCFISTRHPAWEGAVVSIEQELFKRRLGIKRFNLKMDQEDDIL